MAKTSYQLIPPELEVAWSKALNSGQRFTVPTVRRNPPFASRSRVTGLSELSLMPTISPMWNALDDATRALWSEAATYSQTTGWRLFLKDTAYRIKNSLSGVSDPDNLYQVEVGRINISGSATEIKIAQFHPFDYWVLRLVSGTKNQYEAVEIHEDFALPLDLSIAYKSDLVAAGASPSAKFYCRVYRNYQGETYSDDCVIDLDLSADWQIDVASMGQKKGVATYYTAYIELHDVQGDLFFDNIFIGHSGVNWARDPRCFNINQEFTHMFYQIPKHWAPEIMPTGAFFDSFYYNLLV